MSPRRHVRQRFRHRLALRLPAGRHPNQHQHQHLQSLQHAMYAERLLSTCPPTGKPALRLPPLRTSTSTARPTSARAEYNTGNATIADDVRCKCNAPAALKTVLSEIATKGKKFWKMRNGRVQLLPVGGGYAYEPTGQHGSYETPSFGGQFFSTYS